MSACNFSFDHNGNGSGLITKAKDAINNAGGTFTGDDNSGSFVLSTFAGKIAGSYIVLPAKVEIAITSKPIFVSCSMIEQELKKFM